MRKSCAWSVRAAARDVTVTMLVRRMPTLWYRALGLLCIVLLLPGVVQANWMYLGITSVATRSPQTCSAIPGLVIQQLRLCRQNPQAVPCIRYGAILGILECQTQFKYERWNCTIVRNHSVFGKVLTKGTRETAFIHAVTSAGVVYAVTQSCSAGNLTDCSCDLSREGQLSPDGWKWGGCSDDVDYGIWFGRTFVDAPETLKHSNSKDIRALMNLHNNEVGRQIIKDRMRMRCRCHGVSGSCAVKSCWRTMPTFREIGDYLKQKYEKPIEIAPRSKKKLRRREKQKRRSPISPEDLVFVHKSPNYCRPDGKKGILGTKGRECRRAKGAESCTLLCCGRGYNTQIIRHVERCHCKFVWCCFVKCKKCETMIEKYTCK